MSVAPPPPPEAEARSAPPPPGLAADAGPAFGAAAFQRATGADDAALAALERFRRALEDWNGRLNLVGPSAMEAFWLRHAFDSAQLLPLAPGARTWADLGAGAGFPGLVLAILLKTNAGAHVHLVESLAKRCRFLDAVAAELELPVTVHNVRAETADLPRIDVVTARACAPLSRLLGYARPTLRPPARGLFLKGRGVEAELDAARQAWRFDVELLASRSDPSGRIVSLRNLARA